MFREQKRAIQSFLLLLDVVSLSLAFGISLLLRSFHDVLPLLSYIPSTPWIPANAVRSEYALFLVASGLGWLISLNRSGIYQPHRNESAMRTVRAYIKASLNALLVSGAAVFTLKMFSISRIFFAYYFATSFILLPVGQAIAAGLVRRLGRGGFNRRRALVVGSGTLAAWFVEVLRKAAPTGYECVGMVFAGDGMARSYAGVPVLGSIAELNGVLSKHSVDEVFVVGEARAIAEMAPIAQTLIEKGKVVSLVSPAFAGRHGIGGRITQFAGIPTLSFGPAPKEVISSGIKRFIDVVGASIAMVVAGPIMLAVAALIKLLDAGPVFFRQERLGMGGTRFLMYKFRSMKANAEILLKAETALYTKYLKNDYKLPEKEDPRITPFGWFLRRTSLDELPQLWNVLKGEMSLVGPRPIVPEEIEKYHPYEDVLLSVRPGMTGKWQVGGRTQIRYPERAFLDLDYAGYHSVSDDMSIMTKTLPSVIKQTRPSRE
jgi:exopolysaccharide biosynthesis polyprenyl glycosylphosphotransferase